ncbi:hypothetical protein LDENG_00018620 [Lucifuga dentata]|nr:hypothetical protein LDENG_00018620 [Lucifuga dentata]
MTICLNSVLQDLDGKALRVAKVGFTFCHFRQSQRSRENGQSVNKMRCTISINRISSPLRMSSVAQMEGY